MPGSISSAEERPIKRLRTRRACDYCRIHRIRCEFLPDRPICKHCEKYAIECKRVARPPPDRRPRGTSREDDFDDEIASQGIEPGYLGQSDMTQQIRDHCSILPQALTRVQALEDQLDIYSDAFDESRSRGRLLGRPPDVGETARRRAVAAATFSRVEERLIELIGAETVLHDLMMTCQQSFLPLFPAVSVHESLGGDHPSEGFNQHFGNFHPNSTPPTALPRVTRLILCAIPAMSRTVPVEVREALVSSLNTALDAMDFSLGMASLANLQVHLLMTVNDALWKRGPLGRAAYAACRMATGLALHRNVSTRVVPLAQVNRRSRIWGACIIVDRWMTLRLGQMPSIDLAYADAPLPSHLPDHIPRGTERLEILSCFRFHFEMTKLADLLGRAYRLSFSPSGLSTEEYAHFVWQMSYQAWKGGLPHSWPYSARLDTPHALPILKMLAVAVLYTFVQPLIWPTVPVPATFSYCPPESFTEELESMSRDSIEWACGPGAFYLDVWSMLFQPFVLCLIVQAKAAARGDFTASLLLKRGVEVVNDWAESGEAPTFATFRRQDVLDIVKLLNGTAHPGFP